MFNRFSIRTLLIVTAAFALLVVFPVSRISMNRQQREATESLWSLGGLTATRADPEFRTPVGITGVKPRPLWLCDLYGYNPPVALLIPYSAYRETLDSNTLDALIANVKQIPSLKAVIVDDKVVSSQQAEYLRDALPARVVIIGT